MYASFVNNMMNFAMAESFSAALLGRLALVLCVLVLNIVIIIRHRASE